MIDIVYQDNDIIVCLKPAGLLSEGEGPDSLLTLLSEQRGGAVFPVHRLDRGAAGLMVFARHSKAAAGLSRAVQEKQLKKEYFALISGVPAEKEGEKTQKIVTADIDDLVRQSYLKHIQPGVLHDVLFTEVK